MIKIHALSANSSPTIVAFEPADGMYFTLEELQGGVGGYIEFVRSPLVGTVDPTENQSDLIMICDEEGIPKQLPLNRFASLLAGHPVYGDVLIVHSSTLRRDG